MVDPVRRLCVDDEPALRLLLDRSPVSNLFLRGWLDAHPVDRSWWYRAGDGVVLVVPHRVAVPFAPSPADAARLGDHLRVQHAPTMVVGPREACDALWDRWCPASTPARRHDQRLYVAESAVVGPDPIGFRAGRIADWPSVADGAARMEREDLGRDPIVDRAAHEDAVRERLREGRTFVVEDRGAIVFQVNVGTQHADGAQIGGTWVPPDRRGRGLGAAGVAAVCRRLLTTSPRVTLHVNEANVGAVRSYERVGFVADAAFRLLVP